MSATGERVDMPGVRLASLIKKHTGEDICPRQIRQLIRADFKQLSALAHQIHDEECPNG